MGKKITIEYISEFLATSGSKLLSDTYVNAREHLDVVCGNGHTTKRTWNNIKSGYGCAVCAGNIKYDNESVREHLLTKNLIMLDTYKSKHEPINVYCSTCKNTFYISYNNFTFGNRSCPHCFYKTQGLKSTFEMDVKNWLESVSPYQLSFNDVSVLVNPTTKRRLELDVLIPKRGKAIEIQGYYHYSNTARTNERDLLKVQLCNDCGIDLEYISQPLWDTDYGRDKEKCKILKWL
jgi:hypothetical protein